MRAVYLVRHGRPALPDGVPRCLGRLDLPLSPEGEAQGSALRRFFAQIPVLHCFTSPLARCVRTAELAGCPDAVACPGFAEVDTGAWDGLPFSDIRRRWPEEHRLRGLDPLGTPPPGGESLAKCRARAAEAFARIRAELPPGSLAVFGHSGTGRMLASALTGMPGERALELELRYGGILMLLLPDRTEPALLGPSAPPEGLPDQVPDGDRCRALLAECGTPERAAAHCEAVAELAAELCRGLAADGRPLRADAVWAGAMLHDIARDRPKHALAGARWLLERGYGEMAALVADHMQLPEGEAAVSEKSVVFLADKLVRGTRRVTLEERFFADCPPERLPCARARYRQAKRVLAAVQRARRAGQDETDRMGGAHEEHL